MVAGFKNGIEYIIEFDYMSTPGTLADVDSGPWYFVNTVVAHSNIHCHRNLNTRRLFFNSSGSVNQIIIYHTIGRILIVGRTFYSIHFSNWYKLIVLKRRRTYGTRISNEGDTRCTAIMDMISSNFNLSVVLADYNNISTEVGKLTICDRHIFSSFNKYSSTSIYGPITAQQRFVFFHKCPFGMFESNAFNRNILYRILFSSQNIDQVLLSYSLKLRITYIKTFSRPIVELIVIGQIPLPWTIEFFQNVFYHSVLFVHAGRAVVLMTT